MRALTDDEFLDFRRVVKCRWLDCVHGMGLAGRGDCSGVGAKWDEEKCPAFTYRWQEKIDLQ